MLGAPFTPGTGPGRDGPAGRDNDIRLRHTCVQNTAFDLILIMFFMRELNLKTEKREATGKNLIGKAQEDVDKTRYWP